MKIREGAECIVARCMRPKCKDLVHEEAVKRMVSPELFAQYNKFLNRSFIDDNPNIKWCPAPGCTFSVRCDRKSRFTSAVISPLPSPPLNFSKIALSPSVVSSTQTRGRGLSLRLPFLFQLLRLEHWRPHARVLPRRGEVDAEGNWYVLSVPTFTLFFFFFAFSWIYLVYLHTYLFQTSRRT